MPQARHPAASPLPKVPSPRAPAVADFRSPMPRAAVVDSRSRTQPVSAALPPVRSRTRPRWRSPRVTREPEPAVPEPVVALEVLAPAAVVAPVVQERAAVAERPAVQVAAARVLVVLAAAAARRAAVPVVPEEPELVAVAVQVVPERAVRVPAAVALPVAVRPAVAQRAQPGLVVPEPVA
ncbi:hypothetical protein H7J08_01085 [Mycobacterium frederiksbergense]|uniref:hypothetical protein n=1 Tax=Mycolicibacterium frederiksbergense TaxID=117567 RepID=UPI0021F2904E|nr:hypothetical protein [Mycolicibacterium frederiksbergense]MCV7043271.1 hypothetical protein [Mycolicibacterium frederiksbergense]